MDEQKLVEAMAKAKWDAGILKPWEQQPKHVRLCEVEAMQAALAVAKVVIRDEVLEKVLAEISAIHVPIRTDILSAHEPIECVAEGHEQAYRVVEAMKGIKA